MIPTFDYSHPWVILECEDDGDLLLTKGIWQSDRRYMITFHKNITPFFQEEAAINVNNLCRWPCGRQLKAISC